MSAACLATRAAVFRELGGFDNQNLTSNYQDIDFCLRAREHGLQVIWTPYANLVHHEAGSDEQLKNAEKEAAYRRDTAYMQKRWGEELREDPFYSPNLSLAPAGLRTGFSAALVFKRRLRLVLFHPKVQYQGGAVSKPPQLCCGGLETAAPCLTARHAEQPLARLKSRDQVAITIEKMLD